MQISLTGQRGCPVSPERVDRLTEEEIRRLGVSGRKAASIKTIARKVRQGELQLEEMREMPDEDVIQRLTELNGVGRWTVEMILILSLERRDIVSWGDAAIRAGSPPCIF